MDSYSLAFVPAAAREETSRVVIAGGAVVRYLRRRTVSMRGSIHLPQVPRPDTEEEGALIGCLEALIGYLEALIGCLEALLGVVRVLL